MRDITFRARRTDNVEWVEGNLVWIKNLNDEPYQCFIISHLAYMEYGEFDDTYQVLPETVGQHTGLIDKNGKKIFEGDICQIKGISYIDETPFVVEWNEEFSGWFWKNLDFGSATDTITAEIAEMSRVIGNIHDNPELLKGE